MATEAGLFTYKQREKMATFFFLLPALLFIAVFAYVSFTLTLVLSFFKVDWLNPWEFAGVSNFVKVYHYELFWRSLRNV